jgi:hypothetical protein
MVEGGDSYLGVHGVDCFAVRLCLRILFSLRHMPFNGDGNGPCAVPMIGNSVSTYAATSE